MLVDIIALIIVILCVVIGVKKGFIKTFFGTLSFLIAIILTVATVDPISEYVSKTEAGKFIYEKTEINILENGMAKNENESTYYNAFLEEIIDIESIVQNAQGMQQEISQKIGDMSIKTITALVIFVIYLVLLKIISKILDLVSHLPLLNAFNKVGGFIAGGINAYILLVIFSSAITFIATMYENDLLSTQLEESVILKYLSCYNLFL